MAASGKSSRHLVLLRARLARWLLASCVLGPLALLFLGVSPADAAGPTISGTGSSYAAVAINQWAGQVQSLYGDNINYATTSSVLGLNNFAQYPLVDFGASEIGYSTKQANETPPAGFNYQYLPDVAGATCLMYNLVDQLGNTINSLKLNSTVLAGMFDGTITKWNDPAIAALNPGTTLPTTPIIVVYRTDASGDNYIFSDYLQTLQGSTWSAFTSALQTPPGAQAVWPIPQNGARSVGSYDFGNWSGESGSDNASNYVYGNPGSITYVETAYAILHHDPCAAVQNASGAYVQPSENADAVALESDALQPDLEQNLAPVFASTQATAYPISAYSYLLMAEQSEIPAAKQAEEAQFVQFVACRGQQSAGSLGYSPLPPNLVQADFSAVALITGTPIPAPTAANCPNPYVDGQLPLLGEPVIGGAPAAAGSGGAAVVSPTVNTVVAGKAASTGAGASGSSATGARAQSSTATSNATAAAAAAAAVAQKEKAAAAKAAANAVAAPPGQETGVGLLHATTSLLESPGTSGGELLAALGFLALIAIPPTLALSRRRRSETPSDDDPGRN
jgi:phosphate transport system substrate-binding protein